jgi:hypothetical protein
MRTLAIIAVLVALAWPILGQEYIHQFAPRGEFANVLAGQHYNDTSNPNSCLDQATSEDQTPPWVVGSIENGLLDCNYSTDPHEGSEMLLLNSTAPGFQIVRYDSAWPDVSSGPLVWEWSWNIVSEVGQPGIVWRASQGGNGWWPYIWLRASDNAVRFYCDVGTYTSGSYYTLDTVVVAKVVWYVTNGANDICTGLTPSCIDCGCLLFDGVEMGTGCEAPTSVGYLDGFSMTGAGQFKQEIDAWHVCDEIPPDGTRCGDGLGLTF